MHTPSQKGRACASCRDPGRGLRHSRTSRGAAHTPVNRAKSLLREEPMCLGRCRNFHPRRLFRPLLLRFTHLRSLLSRGGIVTRPPRRRRRRSCTTFNQSREGPTHQKLNQHSPSIGWSKVVDLTSNSIRTTQIQIFPSKSLSSPYGTTQNNRCTM
jgi:hypothetical protein